ncbi:NTP transferase domain-containing protein [Mucilaginibacter aquatilis]|uniref:Probable molybdenum cofactor guanylyltransferase n=1 Tax=Mucilaginibacter aquatilis TaxID=1517760 RepID=A0A6I4IEX8_9SPHI|nr:NTP transferase domain-containing protein [Mucilaginibacter aquatilis]MVN92308.1 NTP transferase domain-containing protein [Mucilaginibacter aquatilis]
MADHQKHVTLSKPTLGHFHRNELGILGTNCGLIRQLANAIILELSSIYKIAYIDAEHKQAPNQDDSILSHGGSFELVDKISYRNLSLKRTFNTYQSRSLFNDQDLVLVNANHFPSQFQVAVIDPAKPLDKKLEKLSNVQLILLTEGVTTLPHFLSAHLPAGFAAPVLKIKDTLAITAFINTWLKQRQPPLNGLVLAGGKSERMQTDKGSISYFGDSQRKHVHNLLNSFCLNTYVSYASYQDVHAEEQLPVIIDCFAELGPLGGILSAFRTAPDAAWLTVACDMPYLSIETLNYLVQHRNPSKLATCFVNANSEFPEPLVTIWEPRAYPVILQFLAQGYSCPRKVLINSDVELLQAPNTIEFKNINLPHERDAVINHLKTGCN